MKKPTIIDEYLLLVEQYGGPHITVRQLQIIRLVYRSGPRGITATEVAHELGSPHSTVTRTLKRWVSIGRFSVRVNENDQRHRHYYVCDSSVMDIFEKWAKSRGFKF